MSCTKIKRLKTPLKSHESTKSPDSTVLSLFDLNEQSTISLIKTGSLNENIQATLIAEINKLYKEIADVKDKSRRDEQVIQDLMHDKSQLQSTLLDLQAEVVQMREIYELEFANHQELRKFYEQREQEWVMIVSQHRNMLEQYDQTHGTTLSKVEEINLISHMIDFTKQNTQVPQLENVTPVMDKSIEKQSSRMERKLMKARSLERNSTSLQKVKLRSPGKEVNEVNYYKELSRLYSQEAKFSLKSKKLSKTVQNEETKVKNIHRDLEVDEFFDEIIRKTYYKYKEKCISVGQIENMEDMVKLKNANTSTRERLTKTVKKLNFQIDNDQEFKLFCEYVEKAVIQRYRALRGDFVFEILIEKLKECQKLALSSNSELERLDKQKSNIKDSMISFESKKNLKLGGDIAISNLALSSKNNSMIQKISQKNLQLLVHSTIKPVSKSQSRINLSNLQAKSKLSFSSQRDLSELIHTDIFAKTQTQEDKYFKFGRSRKNDSNDCFLEK